MGSLSFQSPLRRGSVFIEYVRRMKAAISDVSIPSSSGKCLHLPTETAELLRVTGFQSPLRRGSVFIGVSPKPTKGETNVSIPSSSGKCLHHKKVSVSLDGIDGFNPLFVGEVSSSDHSNGAEKRRFGFQ